MKFRANLIYITLDKSTVKEFIIAGWGKLDDTQDNVEVLERGVATNQLKRNEIPSLGKVIIIPKAI